MKCKEGSGLSPKQYLILEKMVNTSSKKKRAAREPGGKNQGCQRSECAKREGEVDVEGH